MNEQYEYDWPFVNKATGEKIKVRASDVELATLRAKKLDRNYTFDGSEVKDDGKTTDNE